MNLHIKLPYILLILLVAISFSSCGDDEPDVSSEELLQQYFAEKNINPQKTASGLYYIIDVPGSDTKPTRTSMVTVHYEGSFLDGQIFDSSIARGVPTTFSLRTVIAGWTEGIPLFGIGGKGSLYIPSNLGYGPDGSRDGTIPGNTPLVFDIELISIN